MKANRKNAAQRAKYRRRRSKRSKENSQFLTQFEKRYRNKIIGTLEASTGYNSDTLCVFIAHLSSRLSDGKIMVRDGIILCDDKFPGQPDPLVTRHCWNEYKGRRVDFSPWGQRNVEYITRQDREYAFYQKQTIDFRIEFGDKEFQQDLDLMESLVVAADYVSSGSQIVPFPTQVLHQIHEAQIETDIEYGN